jgi:hypothetical protein
MGGHVCAEGLRDLERQVKAAELRLYNLRESIAAHERIEKRAHERYLERTAKENAEAQRGRPLQEPRSER